MFFKKIFIPSEKKDELKAVETWCVRWMSRYDEFRDDVKTEVEVFTSKKDADKFANALASAFRLIRYTSGDLIEVKKNV